MDAARYARTKEVFEGALRHSGQERAAFLAQECKDDSSLGREIRELLRHHEAASGFLSGQAGSTVAPLERPMPKLEVPGYRLERELGRGGMGVVYLAEQEKPRRAVALKFLRLDSLTPLEVARFQREAEILGRLSHPGIAHVHAVGLTQSEQGELPWIAMEYVCGSTLREYLDARALDLRDLVGLFAELCDAVDHAHDKGSVHRDLKPSNVLVDEHGRVRVLDFGVARLIGDGVAEGAFRTRTGQIIGTLAYASPEQASGKVSQVNARSDVYSLGVIRVELAAHESGQPRPRALVRAREEGLEVGEEHPVECSTLWLAAAADAPRLWFPARHAGPRTVGNGGGSGSEPRPAAGRLLYAPDPAAPKHLGSQAFLRSLPRPESRAPDPPSSHPLPRWVSSSRVRT